MDGVQVWLGRQIEADPQNPAWQELQRSHRSSSASTSDCDELSGPRVLRSRQRVTLTTIIELPPGNKINLPVTCLILLITFIILMVTLMTFLVTSKTLLVISITLWVTLSRDLGFVLSVFRASWLSFGRAVVPSFLLTFFYCFLPSCLLAFFPPSFLPSFLCPSAYSFRHVFTHTEPVTPLRSPSGASKEWQCSLELHVSLHYQLLQLVQQG